MTDTVSSAGDDVDALDSLRRERDAAIQGGNALHWRPRMAKLTSDGEALAALQDVHRNDGIMWEPVSGEQAAVLWAELRRRGWVRGSSITPAGRVALAENSNG